MKMSAIFFHIRRIPPVNGIFQKFLLQIITRTVRLEALGTRNELNLYK